MGISLLSQFDSSLPQEVVFSRVSPLNLDYRGTLELEVGEAFLFQENSAFRILIFLLPSKSEFCDGKLIGTHLFLAMPLIPLLIHQILVDAL